MAKFSFIDKPDKVRASRIGQRKGGGGGTKERRNETHCAMAAPVHRKITRLPSLFEFSEFQLTRRRSHQDHDLSLIVRSRLTRGDCAMRSSKDRAFSRSDDDDDDDDEAESPLAKVLAYLFANRMHKELDRISEDYIQQGRSGNFRGHRPWRSSGPVPCGTRRTRAQSATKIQRSAGS